jgi:hypothetical protein
MGKTRKGIEKINTVANTAFPPEKTAVLQHNITSGLHACMAISNFLGDNKLVYFGNGHKYEYETTSKQQGN